MAFVKLGSDYIKDGYTQVDNIFLLSYLPLCDALDAKIYLFGLAIANFSEDVDNQVEKMAINLQVSEERIMEGYVYWENKGLVSISKTNPPLIKYLSVKSPITQVVKLNTEKYTEFLEEVERLFPGKMFTSNEYNAILELIETTKLEPNAMLLIMQYCIALKMNNATTPYILAVANAWIKDGCLSVAQVDLHIAELENNSEAVREIFKILGIKRSADLEDRQIYQKWHNIFELDAILAAAKVLKRKGGMDRLDKYLEELQKAKAFRPNEIVEYSKKKDDLYALAKDITQNLGAYYGDVTTIVDTYVTNWLNLGFEEKALLKLAKFCFMRNIKSYDGLEQLVNNFHKKGLLTDKDIDGYIGQQIKIDEQIREVFSACNYFGTINSKDRSNFSAWVDWGFNFDTIIFVAEQNKDKTFPMQAINRALGVLHNKSIHSLQEVKNAMINQSETPSKDNKNKEEFLRHQYTDEELKSVLVNLEEW